jgi:type IV secretion system T-DNA border endonuclease VirD2
LQRVQERGIQQMTRPEVEAVVGANADRVIERAEAATATRLVDRALSVERRKEAAAGRDPTSQRELCAERAVVARAERVAAREARDAVIAAEAARSVEQYPAQPLPVGVAQTDALARLRAEQKTIIQEIEASERVDGQSQKSQHIRSGH